MKKKSFRSIIFESMFRTTNRIISRDRFFFSHWWFCSLTCFNDFVRTTSKRKLLPLQRFSFFLLSSIVYLYFKFLSIATIRFTQKLSILFSIFIIFQLYSRRFFWNNFFSFEIQFNPFGHELFNSGQKKVMITSLSNSSNYKLRFFGCVKYLQGDVQEETLCGYSI